MKERAVMAIEVYGEAKSYAKTIRILGYPSSHVLFAWVENPGPKPRSRKPETKVERYGWKLKLEVVERAIAGGSIDDVANELGVVKCAAIYEGPAFGGRKAT